MSKLNFPGLCVVIQQHTPLNIVEVYLEKKTQPYFPFTQRRGKRLNVDMTQNFKIRKRLLLINLQRSSQKTILSSCQQGFKS